MLILVMILICFIVVTVEICTVSSEIFIGVESISLAIDNTSLSNKLKEFHWQSLFIGGLNSFIDKRYTVWGAL